MNNQPLLFVSSRCPNCAKILETLKALNKDTLCRIVYIDNYQRNQLPSFLKSVPTLYNAESKDVFVGKDIYSYISKPVTARREVPVQQTNPTGGAVGGAPATTDYQAWSFEGKTSMSDSYSSWDAPAKFMDSDQLQYTFLSGFTGTPAAPEPQTKQSYEGGKQGRNEDLAARMEQMKKARDTEFKGVSRQ